MQTLDSKVLRNEREYHMKKITALLLGTAMVLSLAACGGTTTTSSETTSSSTEGVQL